MAAMLGTPAPSSNAPPGGGPWSAVPWRTIIAATLVVGTTVLLVVAVIATKTVLSWVAIAGFIAIVLSPAVTRVEGWFRGRRALASALVMITALAIVGGFITLFIFPLRQQLAAILSDLPGTVNSAVHGRGPFGNIVRKLNLQNLARDHEKDLKKWATDFDNSSFQYARVAVEGAVEFITIMVLAFFFLSQTKVIGENITKIIPVHRRHGLRQVAKDAGSAISGYMLGNLLISAIAGAAAFVVLTLAGVPNAAALAAWVAFTDMIPLVGATIGALAAVLAAFLHSTPAGVIAIIFFVVYQQFENTVLQPTVMARTVKINPLTVLLSVLIGVALFGYWGAVLAIPIAGCLQVIVSASWREMHREQLEASGQDFVQSRSP
jgi:predicted PurR-regulated permease PerM